ncbi:MAG TPA: serine/threonine-protein kinase [Thermoanaerobaculia bacterium]|nr:serine/threonine-protein kinase [Thermoanaerobaculia bacterium]
METSWFQWKGFDVDEEETLARTEVAIPREGRPEAAAELEDEPARIGPYDLGEVLGEGGMGTVYLARQDEPIRRTVALKVVRRGRRTAALAARFEVERQVLALMRHPGIAQVLDAGTTPAGNPYYVMEYVQGVPITDYCDRERLPVRQRLELFVEVCAAIQHAHQRGVLHRDIKPQNVLVTEGDDGKPFPKVIDFGIAKALDGEPELRRTLTEYGFVMGTPAAMSPEQVSRAGDVDSRTDVYSLGTLLYELLVGVLPLDLDPAQPSGWFEKIAREDPLSPSRRVERLGGLAVEPAVRRGTDAAGLRRQLAGDLDWIVMKSLEKDRSRRYASVSELAADVERHLRDEPVLAGPPSLAYRVRKYVRRNRSLALAASLVFLGAVVGVVGISVGLVRSLRAEEQARQEAEKTRALNEFLHEMLTSPALGSSGRELRVLEVVNRASKGLPGSFQGQPEIEAEVRASLGRTYVFLGELSSARTHLDRALELRRKTLGPDHPDTLDVRRDRARVLFMMGNVQEAEAEVRQTLARQEEVIGRDDPRTLQTVGHLAAIIVEGRGAAEARGLAERLVATYRSRLGPLAADTLRAQNLLARILIAEGEYPRAEALARETAAAQQRTFGPENPDALSTLNTLAGVLWFQDKLPELEQIVRRTLTIKTRLFGPEHPEVLDLKNNLATLSVGVGKAVEAEALARENLAVRRKVLGPEHPRTLDSQFTLAEVLDAVGRPDEAVALLRETHAAQARVLSERDPVTLATLQSLGTSLAARGDLAEAERLLRRALELRLAAQGEGHPNTVSAREALARVLEERGKTAETEALGATPSR